MKPFRPPALTLGVVLCALALPAQELMWKEFRSPADGFVVQFPGTPKVTEEKGQGFVSRYFTVHVNGGFNVTCIDVGEPIPANLVEEYLNMARQGAVNQLKGTVSEGKPLKCGRYPGRRFVVTGTGGWAYAQACVAGSRLYSLTAGSRTGPVPPEVVARFHNSFTLFPPTPPK